MPNSLQYALSPYLLQHANNPVNWLVWGNEALQLAKTLNKPILLSIGYAACHWCHVMERESFEDEQVAAFMNQHFVCIKVDREERPDIDQIYMEAVQTLTGSGGWPLNVFLTPQLQPFFGGTYFPPKPMHGRNSWMQVLQNMSSAFTTQHQAVQQQAEKLTNYLNKQDAVLKFAKTTVNTEVDEQNTIANQLLLKADEQYGGFGNAPKFLQTFNLLFLLRHYHFTKDIKCLQQVELSVNAMINGGLYDVVGGGFARYSTDEHWFAPHFEKMLYDNALMILLLCELYQVTKNSLYANIVHKTLSFVEKELMSPDYGFYTALDADSEGIEGKYYVYTYNELKQIITQDNLPIFCAYFNITLQGNWEHGFNILYKNKTDEELANDCNISVSDLQNIIQQALDSLYTYRKGRVKPALDDKIIVSQNALINMAFSKAYCVFKVEKYKNIAQQNYQFVMAKCTYNGLGLMHVYKHQIAYVKGFCDEYAYWAKACIYLHQATGNTNYIHQANELANWAITHFLDENDSFFYYTLVNEADVILRKKELYDTAVPSSNAVMAEVLWYLQYFYDNSQYQTIVNKMLQSLQGLYTQYPLSLGYWNLVSQLKAQPSAELVLCGGNYQPFVSKIFDIYHPTLKILYIENNANLKGFSKAISAKECSINTNVYWCYNQLCYPLCKGVVELLQFYNI